MALGDELRFLLITSDARVKRVSNAAGPPVGAIKVADIAKEGGVWIRVQASTAPKCERCWHHRPEVGSNAEHPTICGRCVENLTSRVKPGVSYERVEEYSDRASGAALDVDRGRQSSCSTSSASSGSRAACGCTRASKCCRS
jgi:hypothetical protein